MVKQLLPYGIMLVVTLSAMAVHVHAQEGGSCMYTMCGEGTCTSWNGTEVCNCNGTGKTGLFCEIAMGDCVSGPCDNGGSCFSGQNGEYYCICQFGYSGLYCQNSDDLAYCPTVLDGDKLFLPKCTLKTSLDLLSTCINQNLPYLDLSTPDFINVCSAKVWETVQCIYGTVSNCSGLLCPSAYDYGGLEIYTEMATALYNPGSPFMSQIYELLCTPPMPLIGFPGLNKTLDIGSPVCKSDVVDQLVKALIEYGNRALFSPDICRELRVLRESMYQIANVSCDWRKIEDALNLVGDVSGAPENYWTDVFQITHQHFRQWIIPSCEVTDCGPEYCTNQGSCFSSGGSSYCQCHVGFTGPRCQYNATFAVCDPQYCMNQGSCYMAEGSFYCGCYPGFTGPRCQYNTTSAGCSPEYCSNQGSCYMSHGSRYCACWGGFTGARCEHNVQQCPPNYCNGGHCSVLFDGNFFCTCPERMSGYHCEYYNASAVCPHPGDNDIELFPLCTLRNTVGRTVNCMAGLTHQLFGQTDEYTCSIAVYGAMECVANMVGNCSKVMCRSIYDIPGVSDAVQNLFKSAFDPSLSHAAVSVMCHPSGGQMILGYLRDSLRELNGTVDMALRMICPGMSLGNVSNGLGQIMRMFGEATSLEQACSVFRTARDHVHQTLVSSCNFQVLEGLRYVPGFEEIAPYIVKGANVFISIFENFTPPMCGGTGGGHGHGYCPQITPSSSPADMIDAYKCLLFMYTKMVSHWMEEFVIWGRRNSVFDKRDWNELATKLGYKSGYGMGWGEHAFVEMIKANLQCGQASSPDCHYGEQFTDALDCLYCYAPGAGLGDGRLMLMDWTRVYHKGVFLSTVYASIMKEFGGGCETTMPPFTDFTSYYSSTTSYPWPSSSSPFSTTRMPGTRPETTTANFNPTADPGRTRPMSPFSTTTTGGSPFSTTTKGGSRPSPTAGDAGPTGQPEGTAMPGTHADMTAVPENTPPGSIRTAMPGTRADMTAIPENTPPNNSPPGS